MATQQDPNNYFFGYIGVASALIFANLGAAYGSAKAGVGICSMGVLKPDLIMEVSGARGHGWYLGYLRHDRRRHYRAEK